MEKLLRSRRRFDAEPVTSLCSARSLRRNAAHQQHERAVALARATHCAIGVALVVALAAGTLALL